MERWKARLALVEWADPVRWQPPADAPDFGVLASAQAEAAASDSSISPLQADEALHRLTYATARRLNLQLRLPRVPDRSRLLDPEEARDVTGIPVEDWASQLIAAGLGGSLSGDAIAYLERIDRHPANTDFARFARAPDADIGAPTGTSFPRATELAY